LDSSFFPAISVGWLSVLRKIPAAEVVQVNGAVFRMFGWISKRLLRVVVNLWRAGAFTGLVSDRIHDPAYRRAESVSIAFHASAQLALFIVG